MASNYKAFRGTITGATSPIEVDVVQYIDTAHLTQFQVLGVGDLDFSISEVDPAIYGDNVFIPSGQGNSTTLNVKHVRITHTGVDSEYQIVVEGA